VRQIDMSDQQPANLDARSPVPEADPHAGLRVAVGVVAAAALAVGLLAGCKSGGSSAGGAPASSSASPSAPSSPSSTPPGSGRPSSGPSSSGSAAPTPALQTHRGTVQRGVEPSCLILDTGSAQYELVGADKQAQQVLRPDATVVVHGYVETGMMSHCMQGAMFRVVSADSAS
jgi:hypothetical protein